MIRSRGPRVSFVEGSVLEMLRKLRVRFWHRAYVAGHEVDFLLARPRRRGLIIEVDGDLYHFDQEHRERRDRILQAAGWEVLHFWGSEVLQTPNAVFDRLKAELVGVPRIPEKSRRRGAIRST